MTSNVENNFDEEVLLLEDVWWEVFFFWMRVVKGVVEGIGIVVVRILKHYSLILFYNAIAANSIKFTLALF